MRLRIRTEGVGCSVMTPFASLRFPALDRSSDDALLRRAVQGDSGAFAVLYDRHSSAAYTAARRVLGPTPAAEDAVQDALLQLWRSGPRYDASRGSLRAWLLVLVRSRALDLLRRETVRTTAAERAGAEPREQPQGASDELDRIEQARDLHRNIVKLPPEQGQVLGLMYLAGQTQSEVATTLDLPLGTVKGRTRLALEKLRREMSAAELAA
jgi:RNA polymerase sigma-70 factor (ECF subfamily)